MNIGIVLPKSPAYSETFFRSKIQGLQKRGHRVILFVGGKHEAKTIEGCRIVQTPRVYGTPIIQSVILIIQLLWLACRVPRRVMRFVQLERRASHTWRETLENLYLNSHILPHHLDWLHFGYVAMAIRREHCAKAMGAKMAVSLRGHDISVYPLKNPGCYLLTWKQVDRVHTISNGLLQLAIKHGLPEQIPVYRIPPAINVQQFTAKHRSFIFHTPLRIITVSRLHWQKGLEYTLEALALIHGKGLDFRFTLIGEGSEYERLCFAAHQLGIADRVHFAGRLPHEAVKKAMEDADIYLQYSVQEGFCNAVLEAQSMGLLCIVSDAEGLPENVLHGVTGWVVPKRRPELLARQIEAVLQMPAAEHERIRRQAVERVKREFNLEKQREEFLRFYAH